MTDLERRAFLTDAMRALGGLGLGLTIGAGPGLILGCDQKPQESARTGRASRGAGSPTRRRRPGARPVVPKPLRGKQTRWTKTQMDQAVARIRVAGILKGREKGQWAVYDAATGKQLHIAYLNFDLPPKSDLQELAYPLCGYAAIRAGHLGPYKRVRCDGDPGKPQGHGSINLAEALTKSCPTFFERVATRITYEEYRIGARLMGLPERVPERPAGFMDRIRLYAHGAGFPVDLNDLAAFGRGLARWDPGDEARLAVQHGLVGCARRGAAQRASAPPLTIAAFKTLHHPKTGESKLVAFTPARRAQFIVCVRTQGKEMDPAAVAGRIFSTLAPLPDNKGTRPTGKKEPRPPEKKKTPPPEKKETPPPKKDMKGTPRPENPKPSTRP